MNRKHIIPGGSSQVYSIASPLNMCASFLFMGHMTYFGKGFRISTGKQGNFFKEKGYVVHDSGRVSC